MKIPSSSSSSSTRPIIIRFLSTFDIKTQVHTILKTLDPIEKPLDSLVPFLSHNVVTCVLQEQQQDDNNNLESSFRFFIWAMRKKQFRSWVSHNLMIQQMVCGGGFELAWKMLEELKNSVNDPFVMKAWAKTYTDNKDVKFLADGSATYTHALGLELDLSEKGLGVRSRRYTLLIDDLKVKVANIESGGEFTVSSAEDIIKAL